MRPPATGLRTAFIVAYVGVSVARLATQQRINITPQPPPPDSARVVLSVDKPVSLLGENVLISYCLENTSSAPFQIFVGSDSRGASRSVRFKMTVTDEDGTVVANPAPSGYSEGGMGQLPTIAPRGHWCQLLPLMRYARIDRPGSYSIRVMHDLGWPKGQAPEGQTTLTLLMPTAVEAEQIVSATLSLPTAVMAKPNERPQDLSTLRYPIYLPPLLQSANAGNATAVIGVGSIPTPAATRALIDLLGHPDRPVAQAAARWLAMRLPDPALSGALEARNQFVNQFEDPRRYLRDVSWRAEFAPEVRTVARRLLASSEVEDVIRGAFMLEAVGETSDGVALSAALTAGLQKTTTLGFESGRYPRPRGAMEELLRAADVLVSRGYQSPAQPAEPGDLALWLVAFGRGARPDGWQDRFEDLLRHPLPYLRELALTRLPTDAPVRLFDTVGQALESRDIDLQIAACEVVDRAALVKHHDAVLTIVRVAKPGQTFLLNFARNALDAIGGRAETFAIMASRLKEPDVRSDAISYLFTAFEGVNAWGGGFTAPEEIEMVSARWSEFIAAHRTELQARQQVSIEDPSVTPDLVPKGWTLHRRDKPDWPSGR